MTNKPKILVLDDNKKFATELGNHLVHSGFDVAYPNNVDDALKIISTENIFGLTLAIQLKGDTGLTMLNQLDIKNTNLVAIVVSCFISPQIRSILKNKQILHYDKTHPTYSHQLVVDAFILFLNALVGGSVIPEEHLHPQLTPPTSTPPTKEQLKSIIKEKLDSYHFNPRLVAYSYLIDGIYHTLIPESGQKKSLSHIFENATKTGYQAAFTGISRLIKANFQKNTQLFDLYYNTHLEKDQEREVNKIPSVFNFVRHIAEEIEQEYF